MRLAVAVVLVLGAARPAAAQLCHVGDVEDATEHAQIGHHHGHPAATIHVQASITLEAATIPDGAYQGETTAIGVHRGRLGLRVAVPVWRLDVLDTPHSGIGDVIVQGHARVLGDDRASAGAVIAVGLPTGKASYGLGMGHAMVMPAVWGAAARGRLRGLALVGGGLALGSGDHDHPGFASGPPVSPMAPRELDLTLRGSWLPRHGLAVDLIGAVAVPVGDDRDARAATGVGARYRRGGWMAGVTGLAGVAGDPFGVRVVVDLAKTL